MTAAGEDGRAAVTVYAKGHCPQCDATRRRLDRLGIPYLTVVLDDDPGMAAALADEGYRQAPVVKTGRGCWSGYRPDLIDALKRAG